MILKHRNNDESIQLQRTMTVGEFIEEIVLVDVNKERKCFSVSVKQDCNGRQNLTIYYQDDMVKSHHSGGIEFDYKEVLDWDIYERYSVGIIRAEDITSMKFDFEQKEQHVKLPKEEMDKVLKKLFEDMDYEELEKSNRKNIFNDNVGEKEIIACVKQLVKDLEVQNSKNYHFRDEIAKCKEREDILQEQIKWLEYRLDKKL